MTRNWWRSAVIYQIYPRSFADSDGDGVGDLAGVTARLPYLAGLGVDAIWLCPFYESPMVDGGYDVADHRAVAPVFGTLDDVDTLIAATHAHGLRIIVDLVPNHTSTRHRWFREGRRDRYHFREKPNDWQSVFGGSAWAQTPQGDYYLHLFDAEQPDLNWADPDVRADFTATLRFWLDRGVDGFRIDVAHGLVKAAGLPDHGSGAQHAGAPAPYFDQDGVHDIHRDWRAVLDGYPGERMAVAEVWSVPPERLARYAAPGALHQVFNFDFLDAPWDAGALRDTITASLAALAPVGAAPTGTNVGAAPTGTNIGAAPTETNIGAAPTWAMGNHDRRRQVTRYGSLDRARAAALLLFALPGSAYLYQGDELGLPEVLDLPAEVRRDPFWVRSGGTDPGRDGCRVPLPWSGAAPPFGFSSTTSWLPQPPDWAGLTVAAQDADPGSTLALYRRALRIRRTLDHHTFDWLPAHPDVLMFRRSSGLVCAVNLGTDAVPLPVEYGPPVCASGHVAGPVLPPDTAVWLSTGPATR